MSDSSLKKIIARRDPRYDGRFYFGVKTTRIYCRPVCPARPKPENIVIFRSQTEAHKSGYRPCKRCHSDLAPGSKLLQGTSISVGRALNLIENISENSVTVTDLAQSLGMTDRHLRRLFDEHLGASPIEIITTKRLHLAKQLITETHLSITEVAFSAGFQSLRRFNEAFKNFYHSSPTSLRKKKVKKKNEIQLNLMFRPPFDWETLISFLNRHCTYGLEEVIDNTYVRYYSEKGFTRVSFDKKNNSLAVVFQDVPLNAFSSILNQIRFLFDIDHNPKHLPSIKAKGIRVPGSYNSFETAINIILGQLISTAQAKIKTKTLVETFGTKVGENIYGNVYLFPTPELLMQSEVELIGITRTKADAIRGLSRLVHEKNIDLSRSADITKTKEQLLAIKGIGHWTAEIIAMRCLGDSDAFPKKDLVINKMLEQKVYNEEDWNSHRSYLTHLMWRTYMSKDQT